MYEGLATMCLKGVLGVKCQQSRFRDMGGMVEKIVIRCNINVNLSYF